MASTVELTSSLVNSAGTSSSVSENTSRTTLPEDVVIASQEIQAKYEGPNINLGLLAGGTESWVDVSAAQVDRYGFIIKPSPSHSLSQPSIITSSALRRRLRMRALLRPRNMKAQAPAIIYYTPQLEPWHESMREIKWREMAVRQVDQKTGDVTYHFERTFKLVDRTFKGIPDAWRASAWRSFLTSSALNKKNYIPDSDLEALYHQYIAEPSPHDTQIDLDVPRTVNSHVMFSARYRGGQRLLFRVLHAFSLHMSDVGYVQGMAPLAANLLCYYDEITCFIMLIRIFTTRHLGQLYEHGFMGLMHAFEELRLELIRRKIGQNLEALKIEPTLYATKWYLTLFSYSLPFSTQLRICDVFFLLGDDGLGVIHAAALTIIDSMRNTLVTADFETAMQQLTRFVDVKNPDLFMQVLEYEYNAFRSRKVLSSQFRKDATNKKPGVGTMTKN
ncbi:rab-GTPase-TBC domain-containing protein [Lipomyces kononenkoae]|uniref:Rab-GTPase-TBC domain-containing protein n=1 Tax=Lipomyces kononenkoae TaxID=34357 RepID=A0ACC3SZ96_LIPKO